MPTNRTRIRYVPQEPLSEAQICYLLDQPLPELTGDDRWWLICAATQTDPRKAWFNGIDNCCSAIVLGARYRTALLPEWRRLHGRKRHPLELKPPRFPSCAGTIDVRLEEYQDRKERRVVPIRRGA